MPVTINGDTGLTTANAVFTDASGNVGIGTATPATRLNVSGSSPSLRIEDTGAKRTALDVSVTNTEVRFQQTAYVDASNTNMTFYTSNLERLRIDSNGLISVATGGAITSGKLISGTANSSITGATVVDFTGIPSWAKRVTVMFQGVSLSGTADWLVQIGSGSVTASGYVSTGGQITNANATGANSSTTGFIIRSAIATNTFSGQMVLTLLTGNVWVSSHSGKSTTDRTNMGGGDVTLSGALDRVRITSSNGTDTFDAGTINIIYE